MRKIKIALSFLLVGVITVISLVCGTVTAGATSRKLSAPTNFKASSVTETTIKLTWNKVEKADAYRIFMFNSESDEYETYKNVTSTSCVIKKLKSATTYKFKIAALVKSGSKYKVQTKSSKLSVKTASALSNHTPTMGEKNAVKKAESYLKFTAFSRIGLIGQLEYEGFSNSEAVYAVDHISVNWNEQAAKKAKQYLDFTSFSRQGLIDQLIYEGFTSSQAEYGVKAVGY